MIRELCVGRLAIAIILLVCSSNFLVCQEPRIESGESRGTFPSLKVVDRKEKALELLEVGAKLEADLGDVQSMRPSKILYAIANRTKKTINPKYIARSCECFDVDFAQGEWKPDEVREFVVNIEATPVKSLGATAVVSDESRQLLFSIDIHGDVKSLYRADPPVLRLDGKKHEQEVTINFVPNFEVPASEMIVEAGYPRVGVMSKWELIKNALQVRITVRREDLFESGKLKDIPFVMFHLNWNHKSGPGPDLLEGYSELQLAAGHPESITVPVEIDGVPKVFPNLVRLRKLTLEGKMDCNFLLRGESPNSEWSARLVRKISDVNSRNNEHVEAKLEWVRINDGWLRLTVTVEMPESLREETHDLSVEIINEQGSLVHSANVFSDSKLIK